MGGRLSHRQLHRGNRASAFYGGFRQPLDQQHHYKIIKATDFNLGDINLKDEYLDVTEAICDELARHYAQHGLRDPEGYFDSADEEVQSILSPSHGSIGAGNSSDCEMLRTSTVRL